MPRARSLESFAGHFPARSNESADNPSLPTYEHNAVHSAVVAATPARTADAAPKTDELLAAPAVSDASSRASAAAGTHKAGVLDANDSTSKHPTANAWAPRSALPPNAENGAREAAEGRQNESLAEEKASGSADSGGKRMPNGCGGGYGHGKKSKRGKKH